MFMATQIARRWSLRLPIVLGVFWIVLMVTFAGAYFKLPGESPASDAEAGVAEWPEFDRPPEQVWAAFRSDSSADDAGALSAKYRLAGTHFGFGGAGDEALRIAVLEDLEAQSQNSVQEGESFGDVEVVEIGNSHVLLRRGFQEEVLELSFKTTAEDTSSEEGDAGTGAGLRWDERVLEENRYGKRIAENRWILSRDVLLGYRQELLDDPERLRNLFLSMKADRVSGEVAGYRLEKEGEADFYDGIGLLDGDVVRKVNSMRMTNQERSEYFIREFVSDRLSAVVLDVERDGEEMKLIYYLR